MFTNLSFYQIAIAALSLYFIVDRIIKFIKKDKRQSLFKFLITSISWLIILILIISPKLAHFISETFGMGENLNTLTFTGFIIILVIIFSLLNHNEKLESSLTEIIRNEALKELQSKKKK